MTVHLLVVGERAAEARLANDTDLDDAARMSEQASPPFFVRRCASPRDLARIVREIAVEYGRVDTLDLHDHGARGHLTMGDAILFAGDGARPYDGALKIGADIAAELWPLLTPDARVRLLGCETARGDEGRRLLLQLRAALGGRVTVFGTLGRIDTGQFDASGFQKLYLEELYLFSSTEAESRGGPTFEARDQEIVAWAEEQRRLLTAPHTASPA